MDLLVRDALLSKLRSMTGKQEGELGVGELRPYGVEQWKVTPSAELESRLAQISQYCDGMRMRPYFVRVSGLIAWLERVHNLVHLPRANSR